MQAMGTGFGRDASIWIGQSNKVACGGARHGIPLLNRCQQFDVFIEEFEKGGRDHR